MLIRDVKPENFLLLTADHDSPLKAIDFGLATYCKAGQYLQDKAGWSLTSFCKAGQYLQDKAGWFLPSFCKADQHPRNKAGWFLLSFCKADQYPRDKASGRGGTQYGETKKASSHTGFASTDAATLLQHARAFMQCSAKLLVVLSQIPATREPAVVMAKWSGAKLRLLPDIS